MSKFPVPKGFKDKTDAKQMAVGGGNKAAPKFGKGVMPPGMKNGGKVKPQRG